ncbi:MAG: fused MFS/spermidine synthase [Planctomycetota bacterium]
MGELETVTNSDPAPPGESKRAVPSAPAPDPSGLPGSVLLPIVAVAGAGTMVVELGAVRLIAPWFGASSAVWTNVIGVVLAALALGYALGARLALGPRPVARLGQTLVVGGAIALALPRVARPVAEAFMPETVPLHGAADALVWGSLAASVLLFLPAAAALGAAGPLAVEALQRARGGSAGAAGGRVLAVSTLGSLAGTFGTTHVLVPSLGTTGAFTGAALVLLACGALLLVRSAAGTAASLVPPLLVPALAWTLGPPPARPAADGETVLAEIDSALQHIRVVETGEGAERVRTLRVNESLDSFQSIWTPEVGLLPPGHYYNHFALPYAWATRERKAPPPGARSSSGSARGPPCASSRAWWTGDRAGDRRCRARPRGRLSRARVFRSRPRRDRRPDRGGGPRRPRGAPLHARRVRSDRRRRLRQQHGDPRARRDGRGLRGDA